MTVQIVAYDNHNDSQRRLPISNVTPFEKAVHGRYKFAQFSVFVKFESNA